MHNSFYHSGSSQDQGQHYLATSNPQKANMDDNDDEIDYSFSNLSVRERSKRFQTEESQIATRYGTLPRSFVSRSIPRYSVPSVPNAAATSHGAMFRQPPLSNRNQALLRRNSSLEIRPQNVVPTRAVESRSFQGCSLVEPYIQPSSTLPRQSRPVYRSSPTVVQDGEQLIHPQSQQQVIYASPTTVVRRMSYSTRPEPRERETVSMVRDIWPSSQSPTSVQPSRVRVYNSGLFRFINESERSASLFSTYPQIPSQWAQASPIYPAYPAYPAYESPSANSSSQINRVVESPIRGNARTAASNHQSPIQQQQLAQVHVPLKPEHRRAVSAIYYSSKPSEIYPRMSDYQQMIYPQPSKHSDLPKFQPTRIAPKQASTNQSQPSAFVPQGRTNQKQSSSPSYQGRTMTLQARPQPRVVNGRTPQPNQESGVTEF